MSSGSFTEILFVLIILGVLILVFDCRKVDPTTTMRIKKLENENIYWRAKVKELRNLTKINPNN